MSLYRIEYEDGDYTCEYVDPFTGKIFEGDKHKADMLCFMLNDQRPGYNFIIKESKA